MPGQCNKDWYNWKLIGQVSLWEWPFLTWNPSKTSDAAWITKFFYEMFLFVLVNNNISKQCVSKNNGQCSNHFNDGLLYSAHLKTQMLIWYVNQHCSR